MKLLMMTKTLAPDHVNGSSLSFKNLISVARQRHQIRVLTGWTRARAAVPPDAETVDCSTGSIFNQRKRWEQAVRFELKQRPPQVILTNGIGPKKWWPPTVVICGPENPPSSSLEKVMAIRRAQRLKKAAFFIATTPSIGKTLINKGIDSRQIKIIPNALDCSYPATRERGEKMSRILVPGHISPFKRQDVIIDAFARLKRRHKDITLRIVGDVKDVRYLEQLRVQAHGYAIQFITDTFDFSPHFEWADLTVLPKQKSGSWNSRALESMLHNCPLVWFENPNTRQATGGRGHICGEYTAEAFKSAIEKALLNTNTSAEKTRDYVVSTHGAEGVWKRIETVLEMLQKTTRWD